MLRIVILLLLFSGSTALADDYVVPKRVKLNVKPLLCIIDGRTPVCDMEFLVSWESSVQGYYCLFAQTDTAALRCWSEADAGQHEDRRIVASSFRYWLTQDQADEALATVTVEVMTTETTDRRRKRRTRHVWDIL